MRKGKKIIALLMALAVTTMNVPMTLSNYSHFSAYAENETQNQITISTQPTDQSVPEGSSANFFVEASGNGLTYLWKYKYSGSNSWLDWRTTQNLNVPYVAKRDGMTVKCIITDSDGNTIESDEATLTYIKDEQLTINTQPVDQSVPEGTSANFFVEASGNGLTYLWKYKYSGSNSWLDWRTTPNLNIPYAAKRDGMTVKCIITDSDGNTIESDEATLTYIKDEQLTINTQPVDQSVPEGTSANFFVEASGNGLTYLWKYKYSGSNSWLDWRTTPNLNIPYAAKRDGMTVKCIITDSDGNTIESDEATLTYIKDEQLTINTQPVDQSVPEGTSANFFVEASGNGLTYLWKYKYSGSNSWLDWRTTPTLNVPYAAKRDGMTVKCLVTDSDGNTLESDEATLTYYQSLTLSNPESTEISADEYAVFEIEATGTGTLTYAWEYSTDGENWTAYTGDGYNTSSITVDGSAATSGTQYRCTVSDNYGQSLTSEAANLTVTSNSEEPVVVATQHDIVLTVGQKYQIPLTGNGYTYISNANYYFTVNKNGVITAKNTTDNGKVYVVDPSGNVTYFNVYVNGEDLSNLEVSTNNVTVNLGETVPITFNMDVNDIASNHIFGFNSLEGYEGHTYGITGLVPGRSIMIAQARRNPNATAIINVTVNADVTEIVPNQTYNQTINPNEEYWYHISNTSDANQKVVLSYNAGYGVWGDTVDDYIGDYSSTGKIQGWGDNGSDTLELAPGEGAYIKLYLNDDYTSEAQQITFSATVSSQEVIDYTLGSLIENYSFDYHTNKVYKFTPETSGTYLFSFTREEDENFGNGYYEYSLLEYDKYDEVIESWSNEEQYSQTREFELSAGTTYGLSIRSRDYDGNGTLSFVVKPIAKAEINASFNHEYNSSVSKTNEKWYKFTVSGTAAENFYDEYSFVLSGNGVGYEFYDENKEYHIDYTYEDNCIIWDPEFDHDGAQHKKAYALASQTFWVRVYAYSDNGDCDYTFNAIKETKSATVTAALNTEYNGTLAPYTSYWYSFTAPEAGYYVFDGFITKPDENRGCGAEMTFYNYVDGELTYNDAKSAKRATGSRKVYYMDANETVYIRFVTCDYLAFDESYEVTDNTYTFMVYANPTADTRTETLYNMTDNEEDSNYWSEEFTITISGDTQYDIYHIDRNNCYVTIYKNGESVENTEQFSDDFYPSEGTYTFVVNRDYYGTAGFNLIKYGREMNLESQIGTDISGAVMPLNSVWYHFTVEDEGCYAISFIGDNLSDQFNVEIYLVNNDGGLDHQGNISRYGYNQCNIAFDELLAEGTEIYVKVTSCDANDLSKYTIRMDATEYNPYYYTDLSAEVTYDTTIYDNTVFFKLYIPENKDTTIVTIDNNYGAPWNAYLVDKYGHSSALEAGDSNISAEIDCSQYADDGYVYLKVVAPENVNEIGFIRVHYTYPVIANEIALNLNTPTAGHFEDSYNFDYFTFTAEEAGTYVFASAVQGDPHDTYGYLYDDEELTNVIAYNDDGGENGQFRIEYQLSANQTVYLKPVDYNEDESVDYTITVTFDGTGQGGSEDIDTSCLPDGAEIAETMVILTDEPSYQAEVSFDSSIAYILVDARAFSDEGVERYYNLQVGLSEGNGAFSTELLASNAEAIDTSDNQYPSFYTSFSEYNTYMFIRITKLDNSAIGNVTLNYFDNGYPEGPMME